jgi:hypothetical protein
MDENNSRRETAAAFTRTGRKAHQANPGSVMSYCGIRVVRRAAPHAGMDWCGSCWGGGPAIPYALTAFFRGSL